MAMTIDIKRRHSSPVSGFAHKSLQFSIVSIGAQLRMCENKPCCTDYTVYIPFALKKLDPQFQIMISCNV